MEAGKYDLEERLLEFAVRIVRVTQSMSRSKAASHLADQLLRSGTSPYGNHGEAESAESRDDFLHKLRVCLKELRETRRWLRLIQKAALLPKPGRLDDILRESDELIRIFVVSVRTAETNRTPKSDFDVRRSTFSVRRSPSTSATTPPSRPTTPAAPASAK